MKNKNPESINNDNHPPQENECFVIMPISDPVEYPTGHFRRVYEDIFVPAIKQAGFIPRRADDEKGSNLIQIEILKQLLNASIVLCDLSSRNPNVLFELGIRQAFDKPVVLVQELGTSRIFDISVLRTIDYRSERIYHEVLMDQLYIKEALIKTFEESKKDNSVNSIVKLLSLGHSATLKELDDYKQDPTLQFILSELSQIKLEIFATKDRKTENSFFEREHARYRYLVNCVNKNLQSEMELSQDIIEEIDKNVSKCAKLYRESKKPQYQLLLEQYNDLLNFIDENKNRLLGTTSA